MIIRPAHHPAMAPAYAMRFDPSTAAVALVSTLVSATDSARKGAANRSAAEFQAQLLETEAARKKQAGVADADRLRRKGSQLSARQRAVLAGSGLSQSGSPLLVLSDTEAETKRLAGLALSGADTAAALTRQQAALQRLRGSNSQSNSFFRAGQSLLGGSGAFSSVFGGSGSTA